MIVTEGQALQKAAESMEARRTGEAIADFDLAATTRRGLVLMSRLPGPIVVIVLASLIASLAGLHVETIGTLLERFVNGWASA